MSRRYSRVSNYSLGQALRMIVFFGVGFVIGFYLLPRLGLIHTRQEAQIAGVLIGILLGLFAKRYT